MVTLQSDKKLDVKKLRLDLKPFKAANVSANHVRTWEKNHYVVLVFGGVGLAYFLLEYTDLSVVAVMCLLAWLITVWDYFMPHITIKESVEACYTSLFKEPNSLGLVIMKSIALLAVPWIGSIVYNFLLTCLVTLSIAMLAGVLAKYCFSELD